jgi:hypothetical protein
MPPSNALQHCPLAFVHCNRPLISITGPGPARYADSAKYAATDNSRAITVCVPNHHMLSAHTTVILPSLLLPYRGMQAAKHQ